MAAVRKILFTVVSLFFTLNGEAYAMNGPLTRPEASSGVLSPAQIQTEFKKFEKPSKLSGQFEQKKKIKELDVTIETSGLYEIKKFSSTQMNLIWKIQKPDPMTVCMSEEAVVIDNPRIKKKTTLKLSEISQQDSSGLTKLVNLIKMNPEMLAKDFTILKKDGHFLVTPNVDKGYQFSTADLQLDKQKNIQHLLLTEASGDTLEIFFKSAIETPLSISQARPVGCL
ncbi:MAG: outer membrane lipoprotein carrier protein LolA [Bdellovibrionaceae bacterium]|nr:outer membrane lipoprotein carrier protein LolA [Bdellovibrio sp.]